MRACSCDFSPSLDMVVQVAFPSCPSTVILPMLCSERVGYHRSSVPLELSTRRILRRAESTRALGSSVNGRIARSGSWLTRCRSCLEFGLPVAVMGRLRRTLTGTRAITCKEVGGSSTSCLVLSSSPLRCRFKSCSLAGWPSL